MPKAQTLVFSFLVSLMPMLMTSPASAEVAGKIAKSCLLLHGTTSYYGKDFKKEKLSEYAANRKRFDPEAMTAASPDLPLGTKIKVTDNQTGRAVVVTITDRGPAKWTNRVLDLSYGAAKKLGMIERGLASVKIERANGACSQLAENREEIDAAHSSEPSAPAPLVTALLTNEKS